MNEPTDGAPALVDGPLLCEPQRSRHFENAGEAQCLLPVRSLCGLQDGGPVPGSMSASLGRVQTGHSVQLDFFAQRSFADDDLGFWLRSCGVARITSRAISA